MIRSVCFVFNREGKASGSGSRPVKPILWGDVRSVTLPPINPAPSGSGEKEK